MRPAPVLALLPFLVAAPALAQAPAPPRLVHAPTLVYPEGASGAATVRFVLVVDEEGRVAAARPAEADVDPIFVEAARAFVEALRFEPARLDGAPVPVEVEYVVRFVPPRAPPPIARFEVDVVGEAPDEPVAAGDFHLDPRRFEDVPRRDAEELLTLAPGVLLRNHQGAGHASAVFLRGFDAGEGQDVEFRLDGMPLNEVSNPHGHGYADTHFIIPALVEEVRVIEGPFDPVQGDFAVAGSAHYRLGLAERGLRLQIGLGSHAEQEALIVWGPEGEGRGTFVGVRLRRGDGFGVNRAHAGATAMAGWEHALGRRTRLRLVGFGHGVRFDSAGVVPAGAVEAGTLPCGPGTDEQFFCTPNENQGGASSRHGVYAVIEQRTAQRDLRQVAWVATRRLRLREDFTGFLLDEEGRGDGTEQIYDATTLGLHGSLALHRRLLGHRQTLAVGYDVRHDDGAATVRRLARVGGHPWARLLDEELRITQLGAFASLELRPFDRLALRGGLRLDSFTFDVVDRNRPSETRSGPREPVEAMDAGGLALQPRVSARLGLLPGLDWLAAFGIGVRSSDAAGLSDGEFAPFARVRAAETGFAWAGEAPFDHDVRLVGFVTHVDRDLVFDERLARNVFVGPSSRHGALLAVHAAPLPGLEVQGSVTWAEAHLVDAEAGFFDLGAGARLPYVPRFSGRLDAALRGALPAALGALPARVGAGLTVVGTRPLPHERMGEPYATLDAGARVRWGMFEAGLAVENLLDARYHQAEFAYPSNFAGPDGPASRLDALHFAAGPPRLLLATLALIIEPEEEGP